MEREFIEYLYDRKDVEENNLENLKCVLLDETSTASEVLDIDTKYGIYTVYFAPGFRLCKSDKHRCCIVLIPLHGFIVVNVNTGVDMHYFGVYENGSKTSISYSYSNRFVNDVFRHGQFTASSVLAYLVLFIMQLAKDTKITKENTSNEHVDLVWFLTGRHTSKPFTSHLVFSNDSGHGDCRSSSMRSLRACYNLYRDYLNADDDFPMSKEVQSMKPWRIFNNDDEKEYRLLTNVVKYEFSNLLSRMSTISLPDMISYITFMTDNYVHEGYMLFWHALLCDRQDLAVWLWTDYDLDNGMLLDIVKRHSYNRVTEFVYSLHLSPISDPNDILEECIFPEACECYFCSFKTCEASPKSTPSPATRSTTTGIGYNIVRMVGTPLNHMAAFI